MKRPHPDLFQAAPLRRMVTPFSAIGHTLRDACQLIDTLAIEFVHLGAGEFKASLNRSLIVMFALLHAADGIITYFGLKFTLVDEANPILLVVAGITGLGLSIFILKLVCIGVIGLLFAARRNLGNCWSTASLISADAFYSWVVGNNLFLVSIA